MLLAYKSVAYAFVANGIQVYFSDEFPFEFLAVRLECKQCGEPWYMNLTECFLCGAINPFLYRCIKCRRYYSITGSSKKCKNCKIENTLELVCPNDICISNIDQTLRNEISRLGGVFAKDSGFLTAQNFCLKCGSTYHIYNLNRMYVADIKGDALRLKDLEYKDELKNNSVIIARKKIKEKIGYAIVRSNLILDKKEINIKKYNLLFSEIVEEIFGERTTSQTRKS